MLTLVALVARMQLDVPIATPLVLEWPITEAASVNGVWVGQWTIGPRVRVV